MSDLAAALSFGLDEVEYQPGYFVWQMEAEVRDIIQAAASERLRLSKVPCETCEGTGIAGVYSHIDKRTGEHLGDEPIRCDACNGSGEVWPDELVEVVAEAIDEAARVEILIPNMARAVLDAVESYMEAK